MSSLQSQSGSPRKRISVRHRGTTANTVTSSAAGEALDQVLNRRALKREGRLDRRGSSSILGDSVARYGVGQWLFRATVLTAAGAVLFGAAAFAMPGPPERHAVAGAVRLNGRPLAQAVLEFRSVAQGGAEPLIMRIETNQAGEFSRPASAGLPPGTYAIAVKSGCFLPRRDAELGVPVSIPSKYTTIASTPLKVDVSGDVAGLELALRREGR